MPKLNIKYESSNGTSEINKEFQIPAKEVVLAPLHGTLAPLMFSLEIFNIKILVVQYMYHYKEVKHGIGQIYLKVFFL